MPNTEPGPAFNFGDFVFDSRNGDLRRNGTRIRLNKQTAELLTVMLVNAGSLVTRSQIRDTLWPDQQMNYEKAISNSMGKLRYIFRDDARNPKYIECIPKRGYRIVAEVHRVAISLPTNSHAPAAILPTISNSAGVLAFSPLTVRGKPYATETVADLQAFVDDGAGLSHTELSHTGKGFRSSVAPVLRPYGRPLFALALVSLVLATSLWLRRSRETGLPSPQPLAATALSLAIVPFETNSPEAEELASSFRLDLTDALSQLPQVRMRAANSTGNLKRDSSELSQEASKLHLDALLFGRLTVTAKDFHLQLELVRVSDAAHLATLRYSGTKDELVSVRDKIQQEVFSKLQLSATSLPDTADTNNPQAYQAYLNGRYHYLSQTDDSLRQAVKDFSAAIDQDPRFARAYAALGRTYLTMGTHDMISRQESFREASQAIDKAQLLDPTLSDVHATSGLISFSRDWNLGAAEREIRQAIQLDPNQALYHQWLALVLAQRGESAKAQDEIQIAHHDDPYSIPVLITEINIDQNIRQYPQELANAMKLKELMHNTPFAMDELANALWSGEQYEAAIQEWHQMAVAEKDAGRVELEDRGLKAFRQGGARAYALVRLSAIQSQTIQKLHPNDFSPVEWNTNAGKDKEALAALRESLHSHNPQFLNDIINPSLDPIRRYREYKEILANSHLQ